MTYIPNAREGENGYKDSDLKGERAAFLRGYDAAIEDILCLEGNLEVYSGESLLIHYLAENEDKAEELFSVLKHWSEMQRNEVACDLRDWLLYYRKIHSFGDLFCEESADDNTEDY